MRQKLIDAIAEVRNSPTTFSRSQAIDKLIRLANTVEKDTDSWLEKIVDSNYTVIILILCFAGFLWISNWVCI